MNRNLADELCFHVAFPPATPAAAAPDFINVAEACDIVAVVMVDNAAGVTGSAVALEQATSAAGTTNAALAFTTYYANTDPANTSVLTKTTATNSTFTTLNTNNLNLIYVIPIDPATLDKANSYTFVRVTLGNATNAAVSAHYVVRPHYGGNVAANPNLTS